MQRQQVHAAARGRAEALVQRRDERRHVAVELLRQPHEPREIRLPRLLPLAELLRRLLEPAERERRLPHRLACGTAVALQRLQQPPRRVAREQRRTLERDAGLVELLLEVGRARVRAHEHGLILERDAGSRELFDARRDVGVRHDVGLGPVAERRAQRLLRAAELRHEPVREREHLRRRSVVLLEPNDVCVRVAPRQREQPLRARAGEAVDRLIVVADGAELVAIAEPEIEQRLLQQIDVLVLVDRECAPPLAHELERVRVRLRARWIVRSSKSSKSSAPASDFRFSYSRKTRCARSAGSGDSWSPSAAMYVCGVSRRFFAHSISVARSPAGPELVRRGKPVADLPQQQRLRRENPPWIAGKATKQRQRGGVEGRRPHALHAERAPAAPAARPRPCR